MVSKPHTMKRLYLHDNIAPTIKPQMVASALRNLEELSVFGMSKSQTITLFEELVKKLSMKVLMMDNKNLKHVPADLLTRVVLSLEKVVLFEHLTEGQTKHLFGEISGAKSGLRLKNIRLDGPEMGKINPNIFAKALNRVEEVDISYSNLSQTHKNALFAQMLNSSKIRKLNLMSINLASVPADILAKGILELEEAELSYTHLSSEQVNVIFELLATRKANKLRVLHLVGNNLRSVCPNALAAGYNSLEATNLNDTRIDGDQVKALLEVMVRKTRLRKIKMEFSDVCQYEDTLVAAARRKGIHFIIEDADME